METPSRRGLARGRPVHWSRLRNLVVLTILVAQLALDFGTAVSARLTRTIAFNIEPKQPDSLLIACSTQAHIQVVIVQNAGSETEMSAVYRTG
jgi:hypothetical protein